jgi:hypothetical protein
MATNRIAYLSEEDRAAAGAIPGLRRYAIYWVDEDAGPQHYVVLARSQGEARELAIMATGRSDLLVSNAA